MQVGRGSKDVKASVMVTSQPKDMAAKMHFNRKTSIQTNVNSFHFTILILLLAYLLSISKFVSSSESFK